MYNCKDYFYFKIKSNRAIPKMMKDFRLTAFFERISSDLAGDREEMRVFRAFLLPSPGLADRNESD